MLLGITSQGKSSCRPGRGLKTYSQHSQEIMKDASPRVNMIGPRFVTNNCGIGGFRGQPFSTTTLWLLEILLSEKIAQRARTNSARICNVSDMRIRTRQCTLSTNCRVYNKREYTTSPINLVISCHSVSSVLPSSNEPMCCTTIRI